MKRILEVKKKIGNLSKNSENPFFNSKYLSLDDLLNAVEPLMQESGLVLSQPIIGNCVSTQIIDSENGEVLLESSLELPSIANPQKLGGAITYFRRYTLKSLLSIAEKDDDANESSVPEVNPLLDNDYFESIIKDFETKKQVATFSSKFNFTDVQKSALKIKHKELK